MNPSVNQIKQLIEKNHLCSFGPSCECQDSLRPDSWISEFELVKCSVVPNSDPRQMITALVLVGLGLGVGEGEGLGLGVGEGLGLGNRVEISTRG